jgi:hypothetical protein
MLLKTNTLKIGRGLRLSSVTGKKDCHVIDFVESTSLVSDIISTPTLLGLSAEIMDGDAQSLAMKQGQYLR